MRWAWCLTERARNLYRLMVVIHIRMRGAGYWQHKHDSDKNITGSMQLSTGFSTFESFVGRVSFQIGCRGGV